MRNPSLSNLNEHVRIKWPGHEQSLAPLLSTPLLVSPLLSSSLASSPRLTSPHSLPLEGRVFPPPPRALALGRLAPQAAAPCVALASQEPVPGWTSSVPQTPHTGRWHLGKGGKPRRCSKEKKLPSLPTLLHLCWGLVAPLPEKMWRRIILKPGFAPSK